MMAWCPRCGGLTFPDDDGRTCFICGRWFKVQGSEQPSRHRKPSKAPKRRIGACETCGAPIPINGLRRWCGRCRGLDLARRKREKRPQRPCLGCGSQIPKGTTARYHSECLKARKVKQQQEYRAEVAAGTRVWTETPAERMRRVRAERKRQPEKRLRPS